MDPKLVHLWAEMLVDMTGTLMVAGMVDCTAA